MAQRTIRLRPLKIDDYDSLKASMSMAYADMDDALWQVEHIKRLIELFPEGQLCVTLNRQVVACALTIIVEYDLYGDDHTYKQVSGNYSFDTHDPEGDVLYGVDIFVHPEHRGMRLGRRLYEARKELCERLNLKAIVAGGRIPTYGQYADKLSPREYIEKVRRKEIYDSTLSFQLSNDFHVRKVLKGYLPGDESSLEYASLIAWNNIYYKDRPKIAGRLSSVVRLGLVQWQMRPFKNLDALCEQIEFFVDAISGYQSDFCLFPELFNAPLLADFNHMDQTRAMRELAQYTEPLRDRFINFALSYNVNIITGSMPLIIGNDLHNVGYLCRRDGSWERFEKIHITPSEVNTYGMVGGDEVKVFNTDSGKVGILICYDVEFPELPRLMALQGLEILFVPFLTDTQNGYVRVRNCAKARAIENECFVAIAGSVGNLPKVENMDIQYAQSAVFTPSDFSFPTNAIKSEATPNTEMTLIVDVDLDLLKELNAHGSVRNLRNRRTDLYTLELKPSAKAAKAKANGKDQPPARDEKRDKKAKAARPTKAVKDDKPGPDPGHGMRTSG